ncbi:MAG: ATP-binding protein [bacterium]|nr:ATP-binding protein [bacterium]MCY3924505.1 ATP-binding protein [bacterium]
MIEREIAPHLLRLFGQYPFVTVTGPRQSGKTTLCRGLFGHLGYANLEEPRTRRFAEADPLGFLAQFPGGAVLDEIHRAPDLLSYLQVLGDEAGRPGLFVLTGSEQFGLTGAVSQSLAGRTALLRLLPFTLAERRSAGAADTIEEVLYSGCYPRIHDRRLNPTEALGDYWETYVERDVRRIGAIRNLASFREFATLCAGRVGQLLNETSLGADAGVSRPTVSEWLAVLEASDILLRLRPYHTNLRKRLTRSPKLYFHDVGLASYLLGIADQRHLIGHPLRGALFENAAVTEAVKHAYNRARRPRLSFFRDRSGFECDLLYETPAGLAAIEIKSGRTIASDWFSAPRRLAGILPQVTAQAVVHGGAERQARTTATAVPLSEFAGFLSDLDTPQAPPDDTGPEPTRPTPGA